MAKNASKTETERLSKGLRTHTRRLKQAARKEVGVNSQGSSPAQPVRVQKKPEQV